MKNSTYQIHAAKSEEKTVINSVVMARRINKFRELIRETETAYNNNPAAVTPCISKGNIKTGAIPSFSLIPVLDCANCAACAKQCYDLRNSCNDTRLNVFKSRVRNSVLVRNDMERVFNAIKKVMAKNKYFRYFVGGDIPNIEFLNNMVSAALAVPGCKSLCFTKNFKVVNDYLDNGGSIPNNLQIIFSAWPGQVMDNKYNFPISSPLFEGNIEGLDNSIKQTYFCGGDCTACAKAGSHCWGLKSFQAILFNAH